MSETATSTAATSTAAAAVPGQRQPHELADDAAVALCEAFRDLFADSPLARLEQRDGLLLMWSGVPAPPFNGVMAHTSAPGTDTVLRAVDEFAGGELPWNVQLRPGYPAELDDALADRGLVVTGEIPLMVLTDASRLPATGDLALRKAVNYADVTSLLELLEAGFGMPPELSRTFFPVAGLIAGTASSWLLATDDGDVSTACGFLQDGAVGIFNVATPEQHRRRGYGAVATAHAVRAGLDAGARWSYLQASPMGFPVYERMGFVTVERWRQWMPARYAGAGE